MRLYLTFVPRLMLDLILLVSPAGPRQCPRRVKAIASYATVPRYATITRLCAIMSSGKQHNPTFCFSCTAEVFSLATLTKNCAGVARWKGTSTLCVNRSRYIPRCMHTYTQYEERLRFLHCCLCCPSNRAPTVVNSSALNRDPLDMSVQYKSNVHTKLQPMYVIQSHPNDR
jgi:hypothetical protein